MPSIEVHKEALRVMLEEIDEKIRQKTILERQKVLGFVESEATLHLMALLLSKFHLVPQGLSLNHRWFKSERLIKDKIKATFPKQNELIPLLIKQEMFRDRLCYGKNKPETLVKESLENFFTIKKIIEKLLEEKT
ncbi:hypothetical protein CL622_02955 [archaeon]|nr:hypothetical protein [archaeon]|tara:strand:+ start:709 stop:1113 length:405 start_codon:yes stop_codon:yes gene_type:complete